MITVILRGLEHLVKAVLSLSDLQVNIVYTIHYYNFPSPRSSGLLFFILNLPILSSPLL